MYRLLADATLPELELAFPGPFSLSTYRSVDELLQALPNQDILLCRSTLKVNSKLLKGHHLKWILTASSGRDHLDETYLQSEKIKLLDAKGANAKAVCDYVLSCLSYLYLNQNFLPASIGIVGYGAVGQNLYQRLNALGFMVLTYDPIHPGPNHTELTELANCDLVCLHPNLHHTPPFPSRHLIDEAFLRKRTTQQVLLNAARGGIVDETALLRWHQGIYCTDVYLNEPQVNPALIQHATLCTPHIAGHTIEAKVEAVRKLSLQLHHALKLPPPQFKPHLTHTVQSGSSWQEKCLSIYNPIYETRELKSAVVLEETFLKLRREHRRNGFEYVQ